MFLEGWSQVDVRLHLVLPWEGDTSWHVCHERPRTTRQPHPCSCSKRILLLKQWEHSLPLETFCVTSSGEKREAAVWRGWGACIWGRGWWWGMLWANWGKLPELWASTSQVQAGFGECGHGPVGSSQVLKFWRGVIQGTKSYWRNWKKSGGGCLGGFHTPAPSCLGLAAPHPRSSPGAICSHRSLEGQQDRS